MLSLTIHSAHQANDGIHIQLFFMIGCIGYMHSSILLQFKDLSMIILNLSSQINYPLLLP